MIDTNAYNLQGFTTEGTTNVLPPIQGNTQVLPAVSSDGLIQGTDTVLQQTAGLGQTDANGFFGATATTNDIFGQTLKSETTDYLGGQTFQGTTDTNTLFGTTEVLPATSDPNAFLNNQTLAATQYLPGTTTDTNAIYGTTQILPGTYGTEGTTTTTTTTTQTTYGTTQGLTLPGQTTFGTTLTQGEYPATIGSNNFTQGFQMPTTTTTDGFGTNGPTTADAPVGYGTSAADWAAFTTTQTTPQIETPITTNEFAYTTTEPITETVPTQIETIPQPEPIAIPQPQPVVISQPQPAPQPLTQTQFAARIIDEDFRRGRPIYNDFKTTGLRVQQPNNNLPIRPSYNVGINRNPPFYNHGLNNNGFVRYNNPGLDRLGRGGSYDVYGRGITPMLNNAGLTPINPTGQSRIKDFI